MQDNFLDSALKQFEYYKMLGEKAMVQIEDKDLFYSLHEDSNSIAMIVKHLWGNMLSRWTDFLTSDGEKEWRDRDAEFLNDISSREELMKKWEEGWNCLLNTIRSLKTEDLSKIIYIRNQGHTVTEAINRQLAHYPYHVGQIVFLAKLYSKGNWQSLSIPKGDSKFYNQKKFSKEKEHTHYTDEYLKKNREE